MAEFGFVNKDKDDELVSDVWPLVFNAVSSDENAVFADGMSPFCKEVCKYWRA